VKERLDITAHFKLGDLGEYFNRPARLYRQRSFRSVRLLKFPPCDRFILQRRNGAKSEDVH